MAKNLFSKALATKGAGSKLSHGSFNFGLTKKGSFDITIYKKGSFDITAFKKGSFDVTEFKKGSFDITEFKKGSFDITEFKSYGFGGESEVYNQACALHPKHGAFSTMGDSLFI